MKIELLFFLNLFTLIKSFNLYSNNFVSKSNQFNSNYFNSNSNNFNSDYFLSYSKSNNFLSKSNLYSSNKQFNNYLSYVISQSLHSSSKYSYLSSYTRAPTLIPTVMPTLINTLIPTKANTLIPTKVPTLIPTKSSVPIISFDTKLSFNNYNTIELDEKSQTVIILATATSMNISSSFIKYIESNIVSRRRLIHYIFELQGFNIQVSLQTNIPLQGKFASFIKKPAALYSTITTNLVNAVSSGLFQNYLQYESLNLNISNFKKSTILSVQTDHFIIKVPTNNKPSTNNTTDFKSILYVILFTLGIVILVKIVYDIQTKKNPFWWVKLRSVNLTNNRK